MDEHVLDDLAAYLDDELPAAARARVAAHLERCGYCREELTSVARGLRLVHGLEAPGMPEAAARHLREVLLPPVVQPAVLAAPARWRGAWAAAVLMAAGIAAVGYWQVNRPWIRLAWTDAAATPFEQAGRRLHEDLVAGRTAVDVSSTDARVLWSWLERQGAPTTTPVRSGADPARIVPVGAAVRTLAGARVSVLAYRIDGRPVTLALADRDTVPERPAAGWWSKQVHHKWSGAGRHSLTWTIGGGTYVMIAELDGDGLTACLICHDDARFVRRVSASAAFLR